MFQDEARFGRISDCRRCWCRRPVRPLVRKMLSRQYTYVFGAVSPVDGQFDALLLPQVTTQCMQLFLDEVASRHPDDNIVMVLDGAGCHVATDLCEPANLRLLHLPPYSPELNPVEHLWDELREKHFHNRIFPSMKVLERHLYEVVRAFELDTERIRSITRWPWIIDAVSNAK
jgi:transposase